jgi:hypothetical protein
MKSKFMQFFIRSAGGILLMAALVRFLIATDTDPVLPLIDPMLGIPLRWSVAIVGGLEFIVALICLFGKQTGIQLGWLVWLTANFAIFRIGLAWMHIHLQATGLGTLTDPLRLSRSTMDFGVSLVSFYLLLGGSAAAACFWLEKRAEKTAESLKMACPACGVRIKFSTINLGQKTPCPQCHKTITLRRLQVLKMACFFCREHIEFPTHALGEKMPCPHCKMDITLKEFP